MEQEDLFSSSSKKYKKNKNNEDDCDDMINMNYDSGAKGQRNQLRKYVDDFARLEDIEKQLDELQDSISSLDPNILIDLTSKLNIGKEIQMEVAEMMQNIEDNNQYTADFQITFAEFKRAQEMIDQMQQYKLKMTEEYQQLSFLVSIREFFEKLMRALKLASLPITKNGKSQDQENKQFEENLRLIQSDILSDDLLGEKLELDQLNGFYVDLLSCIDLAQKLPENNRSSKIKLVKYLEDKFTEAIWINKATDLKNSDTTSVVQIPFSKFNDLLRQIPKENPKAVDLLSDLEKMKDKYQAYFNLFKDLESQIDEKKINTLSQDQLKNLQNKLQQASNKYKDVPYALKLDLKQKQQFIERIFDNINWSINAKGILEERVDNIEKLEQILIEQTQKQLQQSQKLLIKDITERISAVKRSDSQLAQIKEQTLQATSSSGEGRKKFPVQIFIDLFDTYKDLNQYIKLESQLNQVEEYLKTYQDEEFAILKLTKNWMARLNEQNLDLKQFKSDLDQVSSLIKKSIFEWIKYESNIEGLDVVLQVKEIIQNQENEDMIDESQENMTNEHKKINWKSVMSLKEQIIQLEQKDNYVIKTFEGKKTFFNLIEDFQQMKMDLDSISKKSITLERLEEMCKTMQSTFIQSTNDKQRLLKIKQLKDKIFNEMREFEVASAKKEKVDIKRIHEILEAIKQSGIKLEDKKVQLERKVLIANQIIRIIKSSSNFDIDKVIEQYNNQSVQIDIVEEMILENKQINSDLEEFSEKVIYSYDDYEDLMEINQKLCSAKLHFSRKRLFLLLKQKIFSLLTILIWQSWSQKKPLFGFNYNSLKNIMSDSELYDEYIILNKAKIKQLNIFNTNSDKPPKSKMPKLSSSQPAEHQEKNNMQTEEEILLQAVSKEKNVEDIIPNDIQMDLEQDNQLNQEENQDAEEKIYLEDEDNKINEKQVSPKKQQQQEEQIEDEADKEEEDELISIEKKIKSIQEIIVDERVQVDISILKECRDMIKEMWDQVMKRVRQIREAERSAEIENLENDYAYQIGCVDLMDILIEQKILIQGKEDKYQQEQLKKKKIEEQQKQMKEQQFQAAQFQQQSMQQLQQQKVLLTKTNKKNLNQIPTSNNVSQNMIKQADSIEVTAEKILKSQQFANIDQKKQKLAKTLIISMLTNPQYKDLHVSLIESTISYLIKKVIQFQYTQEYQEQIVEFFDSLKFDFYSSEQYRKESFSFKCFSTLMRLSSNKLVDNIKLKKRKLNEEDEEEQEIQLEKSIPFDYNIPTAKKESKKIIDHDEYINLNYKYSNTQIKDPLFKEFYRLLQSKETLAQFRKFQQDLKKIAGEAEFNAGNFNGNETEEEDEDDGHDNMQDKKRSVKQSTQKNSAGRSSLGSKQKSNGQFSSEDEEEYQQEVLQSHPSVLKYIKDDRVKKLIDPIKEEEMDSFIEFCNNILKQKISNQSGQIRIMYNPLTNDEEIIIKRNQIKNDLSGYDTDGADDKKLYDPESIKNQKNIYSLFQGKIHLRPDTNQVPLKVTCFIESTEALIKECPVFKYGDILKQSGESEMLETKEFLIRSYKCETILSLFGCIESENEESQKQLDQLAQDLKNRDRVSIALWNNASKLYIFHRKLFERDHCGNRIQKKLNLSPSELCFALVFKQTSLKPEEAESIEKIKEPVLYSQSPLDFLELQAVKAAQKRESEELGEIHNSNLLGTDQKPKFKKPLPKYRKDTLLKIYVPLKETEEQNFKDIDTSKNMLSLLVKPRTKEIQRKIESVVQKQQFQSQFVRQQALIVTKSPEYNPEMDEFFRRKLAGKRTGKKSIMLDDLKLRQKIPIQVVEKGDKNIFENLNNQMSDLQTTFKKSLSKKSVTISDKIQEEKYDNNDYEYNDYNDYGGINDYQEEQYNEVTPFEEEEDSNPIRKTELSSVSSLHYNKLNSVSSKQSKSFSISSIDSHYKGNLNQKPKQYKEDYLTKVNTIKNSRMQQDMMEEENHSEEEEGNQFQQKILEQANRNMQLLSDDSQTPVYSKASASSMSNDSIQKNRQKLLELASILDQIKTTTTSSRGKASSSSQSISVSEFNGSLDKASQLSKVSSLKSRQPYSIVSKNTINSVSYNDNQNQYYGEDEDDDMEDSNPQQQHYQQFQSQKKFNFNKKSMGSHQYLEPEESDYKPSDISSLPSSDQSNNRFSQQRFHNNTSIPKTKLQFQKNSYFENKENMYNIENYQSRNTDTDGISTPQLSLSKDSYSKLSAPSMVSYSGKRSYNTFNSNANPTSYNKQNKLSTNSYHSNHSQYSEDHSEYDKQTPVLENFVNNTFRNDDNSLPPYMNNINNNNIKNNNRNFNYNQNQNNYMKHQFNPNQQYNQQTQKRPQPQSSAFIYEQDNYQYNSKIFNKSMQKSIHKNHQQQAFNIQNYYNSEDQESEISSDNSKINEHQILDLRDQLDSLLNVIKHKKSIHQ